MISTEEITAAVRRPGPEVRDLGDLSRRQVVWRTAAHATWIVALAAFLVARVGRFGFNPSDQGFVLALSWRVLDGEIPHVDVVSPRPLGSAYLHLLEFGLPGPLFLVSDFVTMVEIIVATVACAAVLTGVSPLRWGPLRTLLVAAAAVVNLHTFTLMAWHTVDGILLTSLGWWLVDAGLRSGAVARRRTGLVLLGSAVMVKQSFMFAVPAGVLLLLFHPGAGDLRENLRSRAWWRRTVIDGLFLASVPLLYVVGVSAAGGLVPMIDQLTGGTGTWGRNLYDFWVGEFVVGDVRRHILMVAACVVVAAALWLARGRLGPLAVWLRLVPVGGAAVVTLYALARSELAYPATWSVKLLWLFLAVIVLDAVVHRHLPWRPLLIVLLAYMASLSWGYNIPGLVAGTLVLGTLELLRRAVPEIRPTGRGWLLPRAAVGIVSLGAVVLALVAQHDEAPAIDRPQAELTVDLGTATPELRGLRTTPGTARYVSQIGDCLERYPAEQVAVLPDNPFVYPAFGLDNPFPLDWPLPMELVADARERMLDTVQRLNREGDYLVLFQTRSWHQLATGEPVPASVPADAAHFGWSDLETTVRDGLAGEDVSCGSFVGVWDPGD